MGQDTYSSLEITGNMGNYSHFNEYKHLQFQGQSIDNPKKIQNKRQKIADSLPAPRTDFDIMERLSEVWVYGPSSTIATYVLNSTTGKFNVWNGKKAINPPPIYEWNLKTLFEE